MPDGRVLSNRAQQKVRAREKGWRYVVAGLVEAGAAEPELCEDLVKWMNRWLPILTRTTRHRGNHKYAWTLAGRRLASQPYPKGIG